MYKRPESVLVVIYTCDHRVLMLQRLDNPDFWQSVTGSLEGGETPYETAIREVLEETGIDIQAQGLVLEDTNNWVEYEIIKLWRPRYAPGVTTNKEYQFLLKLPHSQQVQLTEHSNFQWLSIEDAAKKASSWSNRDVILALK